MVITNWPLVAFTILIVTLTPGPSMLLGFAMATQYGGRKSLYAGLGLFAALITYAVLSLAGLGAILLTAPWLITALQWFGVLFLVWLGANALRQSKSAELTLGAEDKTLSPSPRRLFRQGLLTAFGNPKAMIFFSAVFPQFMDTGQPYGPQMWLLCATFAGAWLTAFLCYAAAGTLIRRHANSGTGRPILQWITGTIYLSAAGLLAISR